MIEIGKHLFQMACWLILFWLTYFALLRKETFFSFNRWFLLLGILVSIVAPFFPVRHTILLDYSVNQLVGNTSAISASPIIAEKSSINFWMILYVIGVSLSLVLVCIQLVKLKLVKLRSKPLIINQQKVYQLKKNTIPFSTFGTIYIGNNLTDPNQLKCIVEHEKVHIHERHWIDLLLLEMIRALQWFNPIIILYRKAIMQNHEYLADRGALSQGVERNLYQSILVNQLLGYPILKFTNSFHQGNKNNRIKMMKINKSNPLLKLKPLLMLPLIAFLLYSFSKPVYVSNQLEPKPVLNESYQTITGKIVDEHGKALPGASILLASSKNGCVSDLQGEFKLENVQSTDKIIVSFVGYKTVQKSIEKEMYISLEKAIFNIEISKNNTPSASEKKVKTPAVEPANTKSDSKPIEKPFYKKFDTDKEPIYVIDGVIKAVDPEKIDANTIQRMNVLKGESAIAKYGEQAKNGVIEIITVPIFVVVEDLPKFPGGKEALDAYIQTATNDIKSDKNVKIGFTVSAKGNIMDIQIEESSGNTKTDKEIVSVVKRMPTWIPGKQRGKPVNCRYNLGIEF